MPGAARPIRIIISYAKIYPISISAPLQFASSAAAKADGAATALPWITELVCVSSYSREWINIPFSNAASAGDELLPPIHVADPPLSTEPYHLFCMVPAEAANPTPMASAKCNLAESITCVGMSFSFTAVVKFVIK